METKTYEIVDSVEALHGAIARVRAAQKIFATYTQEQVDKIFLAAASAADKARISLAKLAVSETGMGIVEDKVIKNHYAAEYIYNAYKETKTCGVIEEDKAFGITKGLGLRHGTPLASRGVPGERGRCMRLKANIKLVQLLQRALWWMRFIL